MRERRELPILFSGPMVRAILEGRKTQTRRNPSSEIGDPLPRPLESIVLPGIGEVRVGDRLYVRETWRPWMGGHSSGVEYAAGGSGMNAVGEVFGKLAEFMKRSGGAFRFGGRRSELKHSENWKPSIHMPKWASRLHLDVTGLRVERLQALSEDDARAEGFPSVDAFRVAWQLQYHGGSSEQKCSPTVPIDPWVLGDPAVAVVTFRVAEVRR